MLRFRLIGKDGRVLIGLGLSEENIKRMKAGDPMLFTLEEFGFENTEIMIVIGETEETIKDDLRKKGFKGI